MKPIETVWIVGLGSYSDYYVECVCETEDLADSIADSSNRDQVPCRHEVHGVRDYTGKRDWSVEVTVTGIDHDRVRKVFSEQIAQAKADAAVIIEKARLRP